MGSEKSEVAYSTYLYLKYNPDQWSLHYENIISREAEASYFYALELIKGRWEKGEKSICKDLSFSYLYAINVLKGPFSLAHNKLLRSHYNNKYIKFLIKNGYKDLVLEYLI